MRHRVSHRDASKRPQPTIRRPGKGYTVRFLLFDWGGTLMEEAGPPDIPMADWPEVRCIDGACDVLAELARSYHISVATNATVSAKQDIRRALDRVNLGKFINEIFCFSDLGFRKSQPEFWENVLARLGAQKAELVMIGDSLEQDVLGPVRSGIRAIWFNRQAKSYSDAPSIPCVRFLREVPVVVASLSATAST